MSCSDQEGYTYHVRAGDSGTVENHEGVVIVYKAGTPPVPVNLTGSVFAFEVDAPQGGLLIERSSETGGVLVTPLAGAVTAPLTVEDNRAIVAAIRQRGDGLRYRIIREVGQTRRTIFSGLIREAKQAGCC